MKRQLAPSQAMSPYSLRASPRNNVSQISRQLPRSDDMNEINEYGYPFHFLCDQQLLGQQPSKLRVRFDYEVRIESDRGFAHFSDALLPGMEYALLWALADTLGLRNCDLPSSVALSSPMGSSGGTDADYSGASVTQSSFGNGPSTEQEEPTFVIVGLSSMRQDLRDIEVDQCEFISNDDVAVPSYSECYPMYGFMTMEYMGKNQSAVEEFLLRHIAIAMDQHQAAAFPEIGETVFLGQRDAYRHNLQIAKGLSSITGEASDSPSNRRALMISIGSWFVVLGATVLLVGMIVHRKRRRKERRTSLELQDGIMLRPRSTDGHRGREPPIDDDVEIPTSPPSEGEIIYDFENALIQHTDLDWKPGQALHAYATNTRPTALPLETDFIPFASFPSTSVALPSLLSPPAVLEGKPNPPATTHNANNVVHSEGMLSISSRQHGVMLHSQPTLQVVPTTGVRTDSPIPFLTTDENGDALPIVVTRSGPETANGKGATPRTGKRIHHGPPQQPPHRKNTLRKHRKKKKKNKGVKKVVALQRINSRENMNEMETISEVDESEDFVGSSYDDDEEDDTSNRASPATSKTSSSLSEDDGEGASNADSDDPSMLSDNQNVDAQLGVPTKRKPLLPPPYPQEV